MSEQKFKLFREKSLEAIESPESLTDYLRVTSPRIWLVLIAVMLVLIGIIVWSIVGRIGTTAQVAVAVEEESGAAYIPASAIESAMSAGRITVNGQVCTLDFNSIEMQSVTDETDVRIRLNGGFSSGQIIYRVALTSELEPGWYSGTLATESIQPIRLLFN